MRKIVTGILCLSLLGLTGMVFAANVENVTFVGQAGQDHKDPVYMLSQMAGEMIHGLKENKTTIKTNPQFVYGLARKLIVPHADLEEMAMRVLPPSVWQHATPAQRSQFQKEFTTLLIRTYASALAAYSDQTIKFFPVRGGYADKERTEVESSILQADGPAISVRYLVAQRGAEWKLYDLNVEGVSLLQSFRSQFSAPLAQGDITNLLKVLSAHNTDVPKAT